jgi:uncharacterized protein involved in response to NO
MHTPSAKKHVFTEAPHRMLFFAGACQIVLVMAWWLLELGGRYTGAWTPPPTIIPPLWSHLFLMLFGIFPFFIFGFLLTVYPRWMNGSAVPAGRYIGIFRLLAGGMALYYVGLYSSMQVLALALVIQLAGWGLASLTLIGIYTRATQRGAHEQILNLALLAGMSGIALFLHGLLTGAGQSILLARSVGLWLFLVPVVFVVSHRMLPFFSNSILVNYTMVRPGWSLPLMLACVTGHALFEALALPQWLFVFDLPLALTALHHTLVWKFTRSFQVRLLAVLHIAFLWLGIALLLYSLQSLALLITGSMPLGRAPLHALGIGFVAGMLLAMASRVSLGHSGQPLKADTLTWFCFLGLGVSTLLRITAELVLNTPALSAWLNIAAAVTWLVSAGLWVWRYAPLYLRPRQDGKAG